jgi:hypothetical protein
MMSKKPKAITLDHTAQQGCADLLEVVLFVPQGANEQDFELGADVRFGTMLVSSEDWSKSVEIGLARATLSLDLSGCEIDPAAHRLGDQKPIRAKTHVQRTHTTNKTGKIGAKGAVGVTARGDAISAGKASLSVDAGAAHDTKVSSTETQVTDRHEEPVTSISGNRWRFSAVAQAYMQSRYSGDESLCKVRVKGTSVKVEGRLNFQPKDIYLVDVDSSSSLLERFKRSPNQAAIAKILLSKHLKEINPISDKAGPSLIVGSISTLRGEIKNDD